MKRASVDTKSLQGRGELHCGQQHLGTVEYIVHLTSPHGQATVVEFDRKPPAHDGAMVHLTLEDGRVVNCQVLDESPYCAVVGDGPVEERRRTIRSGEAGQDRVRRRR